ncbi:MAG: ABC transporter permease [bacterium]
MEAGIVVTLARKELRDSLRNRWFLLYSIAFAVLALAVSWISLAGSGTYGFAGYGRTAAGLVNLVLLVVPLMALTLGAGSVAADAERGTLAYVLAQPVDRGEVLLGKYVGLATALLGSLASGFAVSAAAIAATAGGEDIRSYASLVLMTFVLALAMLSVGFLISVAARKASVATGAALFTWLTLAFLSDLGLMGGAIAFRLRVDTLFRLALAHPLQVFKMAVLGAVHASLDVLGPAGLYATQTHGRALPLLFAASLAAWIVLPLASAWTIFVRRGDV